MFLCVLCVFVVNSWSAKMSEPNSYGIIWDVDGTLVDTAELHFAAWSALAREINQPFTRADFEATFGQRNPEILRRLYGNRFTDQEIAQFGGRKEELYRAAARRQGVKLLPGVKALLQELSEAGFRQAVGSSAPRENLDLILQLTGTSPFFSVLVCAEDTQRGKPDPQVFQLAADRLGIPPAQCLVMEDAPAGAQAAKAGGMKCVAVSFVGHHSDAALKHAGADLVIKSWQQVSVATVRGILR
jgi:beta-phosphoglucomutase